MLRARPLVVQHARGWQLGVPIDSLDDVVAATGWRPARRTEIPAGEGGGDTGIDGDAVLGLLVRLAHTDRLAARVVLQRLLPGVVALARRWARRDEGGPDALDELLGVAWTVVRAYPIERRGVHVAANLLRDVEYHAFIRPHRRLAVFESTEPHHLDLPVEAPEPHDPAAELGELLAAAHTLTARDRRLVDLIVRGTPVSEMAVQLEVSVRTIANHRDALVHRLRQTARELAAA